MKAIKEKRELKYYGFNDWYIPSRNETVLIIKYFKPNNDCTRIGTIRAITTNFIV